MILKISKCFAFRLQVYETLFARVITPLALQYLYHAVFLVFLIILFTTNYF